MHGDYIIGVTCTQYKRTSNLLLNIILVILRNMPQHFNNNNWTYRKHGISVSSVHWNVMEIMTRYGTFLHNFYIFSPFSVNNNFILKDYSKLMIYFSIQVEKCKLFIIWFYSLKEELGAHLKYVFHLIILFVLSPVVI